MTRARTAARFPRECPVFFWECSCCPRGSGGFNVVAVDVHAGAATPIVVYDPEAPEHCIFPNPKRLRPLTWAAREMLKALAK